MTEQSLKPEKKQIKHHAARYGMAGGAGSLAAYLANAVPILNDMPMEVAVPICLATIRALTQFLHSRFKIDLFR